MQKKKKRGNSRLAALEIPQLVLKLMLFQQIFCCRAHEKLLAASVCVRARGVTPPPEPASHQTLSLKWLRVSPIYMCLTVSRNVLIRLVPNLILAAKRKCRAGHKRLLKPHVMFGFAVS